MERSAAARLDVEAVREDFPILSSLVWCKPLVYLDNAATAQKPRAVLDALRRFYAENNSNVHRGVHYLSAQATQRFEEAREKVGAFLHAGQAAEVVCPCGAGAASDCVRWSGLRPRVGPGDEILITWMEHHSNIVPWQLVCRQTGARLKVVPITDEGELEPGAFERMLTDRTRLAAFVHVSNSLGTINPVKEMAEAARARGVPVLVDGAQAVPHGPVDVRALGCDFYAFSGHKLFGPTGTGVLWGRRELLEEMPPWQGGGDMIKSVRFEGSTWNDVPWKFEAGTPHVAGGIGLGAAVDYLATLDWDAVRAHERDLLACATERLREIEGLRIVGTAAEKASVVSFVLEGAHPHDVGTILDKEGVAVRTGHHCTQPVMERYGVAATVRASFAFYNTRAEVDALVAGLRRVRELFPA